MEIRDEDGDFLYVEKIERNLLAATTRNGQDDTTCSVYITRDDAERLRVLLESFLHEHTAKAGTITVGSEGVVAAICTGCGKEFYGRIDWFRD